MSATVIERANLAKHSVTAALDAGGKVAQIIEASTHDDIVPGVPMDIYDVIDNALNESLPAVERLEAIQNWLNPQNAKATAALQTTAAIKKAQKTARPKRKKPSKLAALATRQPKRAQKPTAITPAHKKAATAPATKPKAQKQNAKPIDPKTQALHQKREEKAREQLASIGHSLLRIPKDLLNLATMPKLYFTKWPAQTTIAVALLASAYTFTPRTITETRPAPVATTDAQTQTIQYRTAAQQEMLDSKFGFLREYVLNQHLLNDYYEIKDGKRVPYINEYSLIYRGMESAFDDGEKTGMMQQKNAHTHVTSALELRNLTNNRYAFQVMQRYYQKHSPEMTIKSDNKLPSHSLRESAFLKMRAPYFAGPSGALITNLPDLQNVAIKEHEIIREKLITYKPLLDLLGYSPQKLKKLTPNEQKEFDDLMTYLSKVFLNKHAKGNPHIASKDITFAQLKRQANKHDADHVDLMKKPAEAFVAWKVAEKARIEALPVLHMTPKGENVILITKRISRFGQMKEYFAAANTPQESETAQPIRHNGEVTQEERPTLARG